MIEVMLSLDWPSLCCFVVIVDKCHLCELSTHTSYGSRGGLGYSSIHTISYLVSNGNCGG
jgi:hypothetical protein